MEVLPDIVGPEPLVVLCGRAGAQSMRTRDHYYETPGNAFWELVHRSGLTPRQLRPEEDATVVEHGLALTDLVLHREPKHVEIHELVAKVERWHPEWIAFTSKTAAAEAARALGLSPRVPLGLADWTLGGASVFVLPGTSGANRRVDYDGRPDRLSWWQDLASLLGRDSPATA